MASVKTEGDERKFLRASRDINFVKQHGRRFSTAMFNGLVCQANGCTRVAIVVGRRFGTAVRRNRAKRLFRELTRQVYPHLGDGYLLVVFPKREAVTSPFESLKHAWCSTLKRQGMWQGDDA
jgi:ribonuclease P protein component